MPKDALTPKDHAEAVALFRAELIGDLSRQALDRGALAQELKVRSQRHYRPPGADTTRTFSVPTLERWYYRYRSGGLTALRPAPRSDQGHGQALTPELRTLLCDIRREHPEASVPLILKTLELEGRLNPTDASAATVRRLFRAHHLDRIALRQGHSAHTRLRWQAERPNALWHADVCHGPALLCEGSKRPLRIHAILDDATRFVVGLRACHSEREEDMLQLLVDTLRRQGAPDVLYLDNGSTYRGKTLQLCCERLGITLLHAAPYDPQARGKMERFWRTLRQQCLDFLGSVTDLVQVQAHLQAYLDQVYHRSAHAGLLGRAPGDLWHEAAQEPPVRMVNEAQLHEALTVRTRRRLSNDNVLSLAGVRWQTDRGYLAGQVVTLRHSLLDPTPWLEYQGQSFPLTPVDAKVNARRKRAQTPAAPQSAVPRGPAVPFDPPKAQLAQWRAHQETPGDDEETF